MNSRKYVATSIPRSREMFYSSLPLTWSDPGVNCTQCISCARETFTPLLRVKVKIGKVFV